MSGAPQSHFFTARDGLNLHALVQGEPSEAPPVVCLPGLTRPARDFVVIGSFLAARNNRRVISLDYRGRGGSDWDDNYNNYNFPTEFADILTVLDGLGIRRAIFLGLSRGGLHALTLAGVHPAMVTALILNDVGPQLNPPGLSRIKAYLGKLPLLRTLDDAVAYYKASMGPKYPAVTDQQWRFYAQNTLNTTPERMRLSYDPQLARTMDNFDPEAPLPDLWTEFCGLDAPILALRGENSDLLTPEIHGEMAARHPRCEIYVAPGQSHPLLLLDYPTLERIARFIDEIEAGAP